SVLACPEVSGPRRSTLGRPLSSGNQAKPVTHQSVFQYSSLDRSSRSGHKPRSLPYSLISSVIQVPRDGAAFSDARRCNPELAVRRERIFEFQCDFQRFEKDVIPQSGG